MKCASNCIKIKCTESTGSFLQTILCVQLVEGQLNTCEILSKPSSVLQQSLDDVGAELTQMRTELQKLMEVIQVKDQAIEDLEVQLKATQEKVSHK